MKSTVGRSLVKAILFGALLLSCLSCQKSWILDGTWIRVCETSSREAEEGIKYEYLVFNQNGTVEVWFETAERVKMNRFTHSYTISDNMVSFIGHKLTIREHLLMGSSGSNNTACFYRQ